METLVRSVEPVKLDLDQPVQTLDEIADQMSIENQSGSRFVRHHLLPDVIRNARLHGYTVYPNGDIFFLHVPDGEGNRRCYGTIDELKRVACFIASSEPVS
jgi:hypothetical protein